MRFPVFNKFAILLVFVQLLVTIAQKEIYDPRGIFCGKVSCYDVLNLTRKAPAREIKRSYRRLSLENHPDKNKADNATKIFKRIAKAYEVLSGNESRPLFDYYLDHPRDYFKVSGHHYFRNLPKSDVRLVVFLVCCLLSWFFYVMQNQKYEHAVKSIKNAMAGEKGGMGQTKQIIDLQNKAAALYEEHIKKGKKNYHRLRLGIHGF
jgi:curved DNA-binding protein CbpA